MATVIIRPTSTYHPATDYQHWYNNVVPNVIPNQHLNVDEVTADEDTSYFQAGGGSGTLAGGSFEMFGMGATGLSGYTITNVRIYFRTKNSATTNTALTTAIVGSGATPSAWSYGTSKTNTQAYQTFTQDWATNPASGASWIWDDFVNYYFGVSGYGTSNKATPRCTQFYVEITYQVPTTVVQGLVVQGLVIQ